MLILSYLIIYDKVLLEPGKNEPQNCGEGFALSLEQELVHGVEGAVISGSAKDFSDTNLGPDYL